MGSLSTILGNTLTLILGPLAFADGSLDLISGSVSDSLGDVVATDE